MNLAFVANMFNKHPALEITKDKEEIVDEKEGNLDIEFFLLNILA